MVWYGKFVRKVCYDELERELYLQIPLLTAYRDIPNAPVTLSINKREKMTDIRTDDSRSKGQQIAQYALKTTLSHTHNCGQRH